MHRRNSLILLFLLLVNAAMAQSAYQSGNDSLALVYNRNGQYHTTLDLCDSLIKQHLGYQEIYLCAAYAAAKQNKPMLEQHYLLLAEKDNPADISLQQMLLVNYLNTNQYPQAARINQQHPHLFPDFKLPLVHLIHAESGAKFSNNDTLYQPLYYTQVGIGSRIKQLIWYNAVTHLSQQAYYGIIKQWQYYTSLQIPFKNNWTITPAFHLLSFNTLTPAPELAANPPSGTPWAVSLNISKHRHNLAYALTGVYSKMNNAEQLQLQPQLSWWPKYNNSILVQIAANYLTESNNLQAHASIGLRPLSNFGITALYSLLQAKNFTEQNSYLFNNSFDKTLHRLQTMAVLDLKRGWSCYGVYQLETKEEAFYLVDYQLHLLMFGIRKTI